MSDADDVYLVVRLVKQECLVRAGSIQDAQAKGLKGEYLTTLDDPTLKGEAEACLSAKLFDGDLDHHMCRKCDHPFNGAETNWCPECGEPVY